MNNPFRCYLTPRKLRCIEPGRRVDMTKMDILNMDVWTIGMMKMMDVGKGWMDLVVIIVELAVMVIMGRLKV